MKGISFFSVVSVVTALATTELHNQGFKTLQTSRSGPILTVTIDNNASNVNLISLIVLDDLDRLVTALQNDSATKVVLFQSKNRDFFAAHLDVTPLVQLPGSNLLLNISRLPQASIAIVDGPARGISNEFIMACDMRFASAKAVLGNFEVSLGLTLGAGGVSFMPLLLGRGRTMEYLLSGKDINAQDAEKYGLVNKAFASSHELHKYVNQLANRIALFPAGALASIKAAVNLVTGPTADQVRFDSSEFIRLTATAEAQGLLQRFLALTKNQTSVDVELRLGDKLPQLYN
ncbi:ClpP/crotonase [Trichoderma barbatum]